VTALRKPRKNAKRVLPPEIRSRTRAAQGIPAELSSLNWNYPSNEEDPESETSYLLIQKKLWFHQESTTKEWFELRPTNHICHLRWTIFTPGGANTGGRVPSDGKGHPSDLNPRLGSRFQIRFFPGMPETRSERGGSIQGPSLANSHLEKISFLTGHEHQFRPVPGTQTRMIED